jgi:hypothetical protein
MLLLELAIRLLALPLETASDLARLKSALDAIPITRRLASS